MCRATALVLFVAALLALGGCGESDGDEGGTSTSAQGAEQTRGQAQVEGQQGAGQNADSSQGSLPTEDGAQGPGQGAQPQGSSQQGQGTQGPRSSQGSDGPKAESRRVKREREAFERKRFGEPSPESEPFAKYSGPASEGKLHLAEYGEEAEANERGEVGALLSAYLDAVAAGRVGEACSHLSGAVRAELARFGQSGNGECTGSLEAALEAFDEEELVSVGLPGGVASLRGKADTGAFALFHGGDGGDYWMAVRQEGGGWKVLSIAPQPFVSGQ